MTGTRSSRAISMLAVLNSTSWVIETDAKGPVSLPPDVGQLLPEPIGAEIVGAAEGAQSAGQRDRRGQLPAAVVAHRRGHYRIVEVEQVGKASSQHGSFTP